jgi:protein-S-isoprenylcysteine O-methyltransferase Ste14
MNRCHLLYFCVLLLMPVVDTALIRRLRRGARPGHVVERRSLPLLWLCAGAGMAAAAGIRGIAAARIGLARPVIAGITVALMLLGLALRWAAMIKLGSGFSPHVEIGAGQPLITSGIFRSVRHPAYAGILLIFTGIGFTFENWLSLIAVVAGAVIGVANRVRIEEAALREHFGAAYDEYARHTKRFVPFVI